VRLVDNLTWIRGAHTFKFAPTSAASCSTSQHRQSSRGFGFRGQFSGNSLADFLLGNPTHRAAQPAPSRTRMAVNYSPSGKPSPGRLEADNDLTISLGLRYEYCSPWVNSRDRRSLFDPSFPGDG